MSSRSRGSLLRRMDCCDVATVALELAETVLEKKMGRVEVTAQPPHRRRTVLAVERLPAGGVEEQSVDADEESGRDPCVAAVESELGRELLCQDLHELRHDLELLRLELRGVLDDAGEGREARAAEPGTLLLLQPLERTEDRLSRRAVADRVAKRCFAPRDLVEEEVLFGGEVVENRFLGHTGGSRHFRDGDVVEAARREE